jgi:polar amino acid transport system substrate-binding protein
MERLQRYLWFGNLAELETVLARSIVLAHRPSLDVPDLLFGYGRLVPRQHEEPTGHAETEEHASGTDAVDLIINELAHEFKNPMVTIKTIAQHLDRLLADDTGREQVARLTGEAVDRMDRSLENLLQFTRFRAPAPGNVTLSALLSPSLSELAPALMERRVLLQYRPPDTVFVFVDPAQIGYAFDNLLRVIVRDLQEGQTLSVRPVDSSNALTFEFKGSRHPLGGRLAELLDRPADEASALLPLGLTFAKTLIERNGGRIDVHSAHDTHTITVWLPSREQVESGNGKATSLDS